MDFTDVGSEFTEQFNQAGIAQVTAAAKIPEFLAYGTCYNIRCGDDSPGKPFCSKECRDEYEHLKRRRQ